MAPETLGVGAPETDLGVWSSEGEEGIAKEESSVRSE